MNFRPILQIYPHLFESGETNRILALFRRNVNEMTRYTLTLHQWVWQYSFLQRGTTAWQVVGNTVRLTRPRIEPQTSSSTSMSVNTRQKGQSNNNQNVRKQNIDGVLKIRSFTFP